VWRRQVYRGLVAHPKAVPREMVTMAIAADGIPGANLAAHSMLRNVLNVRDSLPATWRTYTGTDTVRVGRDRDAYAPSSSGQSLARQMPHARVEIIADAGHMPSSTNPTQSPTPLQGT
jgi:pimeloyl-ACP methyl ester carboxylesterase